VEKIDPGMAERHVPLVTPTPDSTGQERRQGKEEAQRKFGKRKPKPAPAPKSTTSDKHPDGSATTGVKGTHIDLQV